MPRERDRQNTQQGKEERVLVGLARIEGVLRSLNRQSLEDAFPKVWREGRRLTILEFCGEPRTQQEIRSHIGSIAGYEVRNYLDEGVHSGVLACYPTEVGTKYLTVLTPPKSALRTKAGGEKSKGRPRA